MKKVYIPKVEELITIESYKNANVYKYLLAKVVESLLSNNIYLSSLNASLKDIKELTDSICYIFPQEISFNKVNSSDIALCSRIINKHPSDEIYNLDNLARFDNNVLNDFGIIVKVIELLHQKLPYNPEYRFTYKENQLLNDIFNVNYEKFNKCSELTKKELIEIEPIYTLRFPNNSRVDDNIRVATAIDEYTYKYGIPYTVGREYLNKDIINNPDEKVKKLIKYLYK